tara:strand:- start:985 stop:1221 length:237 start_codon:yes stop_codon:yes gene_type:complete
MILYNFDGIATDLKTTDKQWMSQGKVWVDDVAELKASVDKIASQNGQSFEIKSYIQEDCDDWDRGHKKRRRWAMRGSQ